MSIDIPVPRMQHSYVVTGHSSQGATYARTIDLTLEGHGREAALVATTRHRIDHLKVVAVDRLADKLESKKATTLSVTKGGQLARAAEDDDAASDRAQLEDIKKAYFAESAGHELFGNVSDFHADIHAFAGVKKPEPTRAQGLPTPMAKPLREARMQAIATKLRRSSSAALPPRQETATVTLTPSVRRKLIGWWETLKFAGDKTNRWLSGTRGISSEVIAKFSANIRGWSSDKGEANRFGAAFAHRDAELRLTGIMRRGPNGFSPLLGGDYRGLFQAGELAAPSKVYLARTGIDALSLYQFDGQPDRAALLAIDDGFHANIREILVRRAREWPGTVWHVSEDNDVLKIDGAAGEGFVDGRRYPEDVIAAIREGDSTAEIVTRDPGADYQTWNDRIRGPDFTKAAVASRHAAEEAARRREAAPSTSRPVRTLQITRGPKYTP